MDQHWHSINQYLIRFVAFEVLHFNFVFEFQDIFFTPKVCQELFVVCQKTGPMHHQPKPITKEIPFHPVQYMPAKNIQAYEHIKRRCHDFLSAVALGGGVDDDNGCSD